MRRSGAGCLLGSSALEAGDQVVELQLFEALAHGVELPGGVLDQLAAFLHKLECLAQAGLVRVEAADDRLEPLDGGFVRAGLRRHRIPIVSAPATCRRPSAARTR